MTTCSQRVSSPLLLAVLLLVAALGAELTDEVRASFDDFKRLHGKRFSSPAEERRRLEIFSENLETASRLQALDPGAQYGVTPVSHLSPSELLLPSVPVAYRDERLPTAMSPSDAEERKRYVVPETYDLRTSGALSSIKDQTNLCGACWAFAAIAVVEARFALKYNRTVSFSAGQVLDCDEYDGGCEGGSPKKALKWLSENGGVELASTYSYAPAVQNCGFDASRAKAKVTTLYDAAGVWPIKEAVYRHGPVALCLDGAKFQSYGGGIMNEDGCNAGSSTHCVAIVGWGREGETPYWILRNSWGKTWGEMGYSRLVMGKNACGVEDLVTNAEVLSVGKLPPSDPADVDVRGLSASVRVSFGLLAAAASVSFLMTW